MGNPEARKNFTFTMMTQLSYTRFLRLIQILFFVIWILVFWNYYRGNFPNSPWFIILTVGFTLLMLTWFMHVQVLIPYFLDRKRYLLYGLGLLIIMLLFVEILLFTERSIAMPADWEFFRNRYYQSIEPRSLFWYFEQIGMTIIIYSISGLSVFVKKWINNLLHQSQLEKEKLQAELKMLKAQVNPHFLFNTLNNIYTLAYMKADNAAPMVEKLSSLMRYMLSECASKRVNLQRELSFLENYIELQSLKKQEAYNVDFYTEGIRQKHEIAPLILINFVENAFKHSDIETNPNGWISTSCVLNSNDELNFTIENSKKQFSTNTGNGFGSEGAKKLLELNYPSQYTLKIETKENTFKIDLTIQL